ncbi:hypothetical protein D3C75_1276620 [compost metagenome]
MKRPIIETMAGIITKLLNVKFEPEVETLEYSRLEIITEETIVVVIECLRIPK